MKRCSPPGLPVCLSAAVQSSAFVPLQPPSCPPPAVCQRDTDAFIMQTLLKINVQYSHLIFIAGSESRLQDNQLFKKKNKERDKS